MRKIRRLQHFFTDSGEPRYLVERAERRKQYVSYYLSSLLAHLLNWDPRFGNHLFLLLLHLHRRLQNETQRLKCCSSVASLDDSEQNVSIQ